jgi:tetratricopeptide (TPR) repeat protein
VDQVRNTGRQQREDIVLQAVFDTYRRSHKIGNPDLDMDLQNVVLRHLGAIGGPVCVNVLVRLPELRDYFDRIGIDLETSRSRFLMRAITAMAYRGLVFRLTPHPQLLSVPADNKNAPVEYRYVLHRVIQRYAVSRIGTSERDSISRDDFAPTVFAAMRSTSGGLTKESYHFIRSLMIGLSQYPDIPQDDESLRPWLFTTNNLDLRAEALRSALALARSTLSVAMITQLKDQEPHGPGLPKRGYLESYKVRLRWILRMAWEIPSKERTVDALYRDEIVWLYNELGVIALTQGNLNEALGFLRQAAEMNECIEGRSRSGPIYDRINVNHAIVQLERGRIDSARSRLSRVLEATRDEPSVLHWIVRGYLCRIDHITAKEGLVSAEFESVTEALQHFGEHRATATMLLHRGQHLFWNDQAAAEDVLKQAQSLAEVGGHEDLRLQIELARLWHHVSAGSDDGVLDRTFANGRSGTRLLGRLNEIEDYGRRMWIWSLQADALRLRSNFLLIQGETSSAGSLVVRSMAICLRNRMMLRLNSGLTIYAKILHSRGDTEGAIRNGHLSLSMARASHYNLELSRVRYLLEQIEPTGVGRAQV